MPVARTSRRLTLSLALGSSLLLGACGGGFYYEDGYYGDDDRVAPNVSIAAPAQAVAGATIQLSAAAVDDWSGIYQVGFYRVDGGTAVLVGTDTANPYELSFVVPNDGRSFVEVFAWAQDRAGNERDSAVVRIAIGP
jgi:hypothetical protein